MVRDEGVVILPKVAPPISTTMSMAGHSARMAAAWSGKTLPQIIARAPLALAR